MDGAFQRLLQHLLLLAQGTLGELGHCHILHRSQRAQRFAFVIEGRLALLQYILDPTVLHQQSMLDLEGRTLLQCIGVGLVHRFAIIGMYASDECLIGGAELLRVALEDAKDLIRPH